MINLLLLFSLSFNIAHATIIAVVDDCTDCHNNTVYDYTHVTEVTVDPADLCTMDHCFHFTAIMSVSDINFDHLLYSEQPKQKNTFYTPPSKEMSIKPPIA